MSLFSSRYYAYGLFAIMAMTLAGPAVAQTGPEDLVTDQATLDTIMAKGMEVCGEAPQKAPPGNTWKFYSPATGLGKSYYFAGRDEYLCAEDLDSFFWTGSRYHNFSCSGSSCARRESWDGKVGAQLPLDGTIRHWTFIWYSHPARTKDELVQVK